LPATQAGPHRGRQTAAPVAGDAGAGARPAAYKWIALSNTTLGVLMAALNSNIILISLPAVFRGIHVDPLAPGEVGYLLWVLMGYMVVTSVFLVTFGRISDMYGRVRLYNAGFLVFTLGSVLLFLTPGRGNTAALLLIAFRLVQGIGGAFLFANSAAILTDAFPPAERGLAMGINQIAGIGGSLIGLIVGGVLAGTWWRGIFLVSVPVGVVGTVWAYLMLRETATARARQRIDWLGNLTFAAGLTGLLLGVTYGIMPYGTQVMGWSNPLVLACLASGVALLGTFVWVESRVSDPMFRLDLFRIRMFTAGNLSGFLGALARGGLQFMLVIWLQGIWLPLHGVSFEDTPLQAGLALLPLMAGFLVMAPLSGALSDRFGARGFATAGMVISAVGFWLLTRLPADFHYWTFAAVILFMGIGMGMFAAPNTAAIMNALPPEHRGVGSGMRATFQNAASMLSMGAFFTVVLLGLSRRLPGVLQNGLVAAGLPAEAAARLAHLPPTAALFAAFLGYNPLGTLLPAPVLRALPAATREDLLSLNFFPSLLAPAFLGGLHDAFYISIALSLLAALASALRGERYIHGQADAAAGPHRRESRHNARGYRLPEVPQGQPVGPALQTRERRH
jgi:MFS family permease